MILVDTSVWVDHFHKGVRKLETLMVSNFVLVHPFVVGELACGNITNRKAILRLLSKVPRASLARDSEALLLIEQYKLMGQGIGCIDVHLLASTRIHPGSLFWTRDKRLAAIAWNLGIAYTE